MIPYTIERRTDTSVSNVTMGIWLFLASEVMLFGSLVSAYALLRVSAPEWPAGSDVLNVRIAAINTLLLIAGTGAAWRARRTDTPQQWLLTSTVLALGFLLLKGLEYRAEIGAGLLPSTSTFLATYFTMTGLHALHVVGGAVANLWAFVGARQSDGLTAGRVHALSLYWGFVDLIWFVILVLFYVS